MMTANEGRLYQKEFHGRNDEGTNSCHSFITACCDFKNELSRF
jgi:hypothetical protein